MKVAFALLALMVTTPVSAAVRSTLRISDVFAALRPGSLLALDLDHTVIRAVGDHGSDAHYDHILQRYSRTMDPVAAANRASVEWGLLQETTSVVPVEADIVRHIAEAQRASRIVIGLTARTREMATSTQRQLTSIGVSFQNGAVTGETLDLSADTFFSGGILYVGPTLDKGRALLLLLDRLRILTTHIVFADDKPHYAEGVNAAATSAGIAVDAFRYGGADDFVRGYWSRACRNDVSMP